MKAPRVGVLGGMGPAATILMQQRLIDAVTVSGDNGHIPLLVDMNPQVPSRIDYLLHDSGVSPGPVLSRMARNLEAGGVDVLAMPCCTAHYFADQIEQSISIPFLNMVALAAAQIAERVFVHSEPPAARGMKIGVLASPATERVGLFEQALAPYGLTALYAEDASAILNIIEGIKRDGPLESYSILTQLAVAQLSERGARAILVGCSEFSLISEQLNSPLPVVDSLDVLVDRIAQFKT